MDAKRTKMILMIMSIVMAVLVLGVCISLAAVDSAAHSEISLLAQQGSQTAPQETAWHKLSNARTTMQSLTIWLLPALALVYQFLLVWFCRSEKKLMLVSGVTLLCAWLVSAVIGYFITNASFGMYSADTYLYIIIGSIRTAIVWAVTAVLFWIFRAAAHKKAKAGA